MTEQEYLNIIENTIAEIESINFDNNWSYEQVLHSILKIHKLPIILFKLPAGSHLFRSRINKDNNLYKSISEISIPEERFVTKYARANKPLQSLFYASETRPTSYMEFLIQLAESTHFGEEVSLTLGAWRLNRELELVLVFDPNSPRNNEYYKYHGASFDQMINDSPKELQKGSVRFFEYIGAKYARLITKDYYNYFITCAYSNVVFAYNNCDGIMYPAVANGGDTFNVVLKKNVISEKALELIQIHADKFRAEEQENGKHHFLNIAGIDASKIENGEIEWNNDWIQYI